MGIVAYPFQSAHFCSDMVKRTRDSNSSAISEEVGESATAGAAAADVMIAAQVPADVPSHAASDIAEASPPRVSTAMALPPSPATNRERFRAASMPAQISCDLSCVQPETGMRFSFQAIVLIVYPAQSSPVRRHVLLADGYGVAGVTVWNANVNAFSNESIGRMAQFTKMSLVRYKNPFKSQFIHAFCQVVHNGTRSISMNKESTVSFTDGNGHFAHTWWHAIPAQKATAAIHFVECKENSVVNIEGILGSVCSEWKLVRNEQKELLTIRIVDRTGIIQVRSWNHSASSFEHLVDQPIRINRVRVAGFASTKVGELLDGKGSILVSEFDGTADLTKFWSE
jgi:hypothetical protein